MTTILVLLTKNAVCFLALPTDQFNLKKKLFLIEIDYGHIS